ncbi:putative transporter ADD1 (major facilitator superfamily) [Handroanthus impetiginosus]|uniref:Putative transporter ADD1 (Major facilitator superfamily) n=1 Tax=Handroanthus impetiginosus TaxID=429701 RepID=A0A2G9GWA8_9LAMI|nr:putative transporter ADD1 (major facilitator superfamily) [Handroanthus impetiginosus]
MENWKNLLHLFVTVFLSYFATLLVNPTIADVTMEAVCPGKDECSLAIYLTGFQQAVAGVGSVIIMPLIGKMSDAYGRKALLTIPLSLAIVPLAILAVKRTTEFFYVYYALQTLTAMVTEGGIICLALSYLADNVSEGKRVSAFGILSGVVAAANVCGTLTARLLPTNRIYQVAAVVAALAAVYMRIFLQEKTSSADPLEHPILKPAIETTEAENEPLTKTDVIKKIPLPKEVIRLLKSSPTVPLASVVAFFNSLAEAGIQSFLMYYLKARFQFQKDQFADIWLITYIAATLSSMVLMPILGPLLGEETLLCMGLFAGFLNMFLDSIAWAPWVPYISATLGIFLFLASPSIRCIISKQVGPYEQGIAQGCLMGITSFANVISPLIYSPLSALFLSDSAPFNFPGFSILCVGLAWFIGFLLSVFIKFRPFFSRERARSEPCLLA